MPKIPSRTTRGGRRRRSQRPQAWELRFKYALYQGLTFKEPHGMMYTNARECEGQTRSGEPCRHKARFKVRGKTKTGREHHEAAAYMCGIHRRGYTLCSALRVDPHASRKAELIAEWRAHPHVSAHDSTPGTVRMGFVPNPMMPRSPATLVILPAGTPAWDRVWNGLELDHYGITSRDLHPRASPPVATIDGRVFPTLECAVDMRCIERPEDTFADSPIRCTLLAAMYADATCAAGKAAQTLRFLLLHGMDVLICGSGITQQSTWRVPKTPAEKRATRNKLNRLLWSARESQEPSKSLPFEYVLMAFLLFGNSLNHSAPWLAGVARPPSDTPTEQEREDADAFTDALAEYVPRNPCLLERALGGGCV